MSVGEEKSPIGALQDFGRQRSGGILSEKRKRTSRDQPQQRRRRFGFGGKRGSAIVSRIHQGALNEQRQGGHEESRIGTANRRKKNRHGETYSFPKQVNVNGLYDEGGEEAYAWRVPRIKPGIKRGGGTHRRQSPL